ncbi:tetratricopeptide repeat protein [Microcoleus sp. Z1_B2]|uniref:tetratricopeptide repeat protein n=1 Tax=Microcoleus sp. Z1_B2 TaxID=3055429 RepID=UPI002FD20C21
MNSLNKVDNKLSLEISFEELEGLLNSYADQANPATICLHLKTIEYLKPQSAKYYHHLGELLLKLKQPLLWKLTILTYQKLIDDEPMNSWTHHFLGDAFLQIEKWPEAIASFNAAIKINPHFSWSYHNLGDALLKVQEWDDAIVAYQSAIKLNPSFIWSYHNLGEAFMNTKQWEEAVNAYEGALMLDLNNFTPLINRLSQSYFKLGLLQLEEGKIDLALASYEKAVNTHPEKVKDYSELQECLARCFYKLAIEQAEKGDLDIALNLFKKAPQRAQESFAYNYLWNGLNQLGILNENSPYCREIQRTDAEIYFRENSNYRLIMWEAITESDKDFLATVGISLAHLELIKENNKVLEEIYINSFDNQESTIKLSATASSHNLFQQTIVTTGYIYSICPFSGKIVRSNQSFYDPYWLPMFSYRFVGREVFYLMTGHFWGGKICIYIPRLETIIGFAYVHNRLEEIVDRLKSSMVSCWQDVKTYISSSDPKPVACVSGILSNIGHYFWNEVSGIHDLYENGNLPKVDKFLVGSNEYLRMSYIFPEEIPETKVERLSDDWSIFQTILKNNYMALRSAGVLVKDQLADKIYLGSQKRCSPDFLKIVEESQSYFPLVWIGIRTNQRVWKSQTQGIVNIIRSLYADFPNMAVVLDGWSRIERDDYYGGLMIDTERPIANEILAMIPSQVKIYDIIGSLSYEKVVWGYAVDTWIASLGSGNAFTTWIANKPGVGLGNKEFCTKVKADLLGRENIVMPITVPDEAIVDLDESVHHLNRNYECDWKAVYDEIKKIILKIKRE